MANYSTLFNNHITSDIGLPAGPANITQTEYTDVAISGTRVITHAEDANNSRIVQVATLATAEAGPAPDTDIDYTLANESNFIQESATSGTDFISTYVRLHDLGTIDYTTEQPYYVTTSDNNQIDLTTSTGINSCVITSTEYDDTSIRGLVSFDNRTNWSKWTGTTWSGVTTDLDTALITEDTPEVPGHYDSYTKLLLHADGDTTTSGNHTIINGNDIIYETGALPVGSGFVSLNGVDNALGIVDHADLHMDGENYTVECWFKTAGESGQALIGKWAGSGVRWAIYFLDLNNLAMYLDNGGWVTITTSIQAETWYHFAWVHYANDDNKFYIDGVEELDYNESVTNDTNTLYFGGLYSTTANLEGSFADIHLSKGITRYTSEFTRPTTRAVEDEYTVLLLPCIGDDAGLHNITLNGSMSMAPDGQFAGSYPFTGGPEYISIPDSTDWYFGTGDFTIDFWLEITTQPTNFTLFSQAADANNQYRLDYIPGTARLLLYVESGGASNYREWYCTFDPTLDTWYHIAVVKEGTGMASGNIKLYVNGTSQSITHTTGGTVSEFPNLSAVLEIGRDILLDQYLSGKIDEFRVSKGIARWTENFSPPTTVYAADIGYSPSVPHLGNTVSEIQTGLTNLTITDETHLDFVFDLYTTNSAVSPSVDQVTLDYGQTGYYIIDTTNFDVVYTSTTSTTITKNSADNDNIKVSILI